MSTFYYYCFIFQIESYMHDHKTQTPFVRVLRRRSKTFTPIIQSDVRDDVITPRTALEGFINNGNFLNAIYTLYPENFLIDQLAEVA